MSAVAALRTAVVALGLEHRPERAVNGAHGGALGASSTEVQVLLLSTGDDKAVLIGADLIWFASDQAGALRAEIARRTGAAEEAVVLCASHTHGTPNPEQGFPQWPYSRELVDEIGARILQAVDKAVAAEARPVSLAVGRSVAPGIAINRRRVAWRRDGIRWHRRVQNLPNPSRPVDPRVAVLAFVSAQNSKPVALLVHFACHPVADPPDRRGGDFPGFLREELRRRFGQETAIVFLQGFCGDVRPALLRRSRGIKDRVLQLLIGDRFRAGEGDDAARIGAELAEGVAAALKSAKSVDQFALTAARETIVLVDVDQAPTGRNLDVTVWRWSDDLRLVFASAEMLSGLAPSSPNTLAVGYANGMAGYIAPAADYAGGGYEIDGFLTRFGLAKRFDPGIGAAFTDLVARM